ncbi:MAG: M20 family metallopeptidase [Actinomycetes bacterium]
MPDYLAEATALVDDITDLRHRLHEHPELGLDLPWTQATVLDALEGLVLEITTGELATSITAVLRGGADAAESDRPVVLLRGDMDGLPITEATGMPFSSKLSNRMHGCGHDVHTAALVGAVKLLHAHRAELPGDVVFMFQPGEEILKGALAMLDEGVLDAAGRRVDRAFGMHVFSSLLPAGTWVTRPGTVLAASDRLDVDIVGVGGHGSTPSLANDPVPVMAEVILAIQTMVAKKFAPSDPAVVNVGVANAGGAANVIPESCHLEMTIRTFSADARAKVQRLLTDLVRGVCAAHGVRAELNYQQGVGPTVNDPDVTAFAVDVIRGLVGERFMEMPQPLAGAEDFAEVLARVPGAFICYSGVPQGGDPASFTFNHSATAWFDDGVIGEAMAVYAALAHESLIDLAGADAAR